MEKFPIPVTKRCHKNILEEMNKSICFINLRNDIGFFCHIKYENKFIGVIIINNYINDEEYKNEIDVVVNNEVKKIYLENIIYKDKSFNISIIKIKDKIQNIKFIEIDDKLYENESEIDYNNEDIYIIQYNKEILVSYGKIKEVNIKNEILYEGNIDINSECYLIFRICNNKLIGINNNSSKYFNRGIYLNSIINKFLSNYIYLNNKYICINKMKMKKKYKYYENDINEITILVDIEEEDIKKEIYFLDNLEKKFYKNIKDRHNNLKELNLFNTELYINNKKNSFKNYFQPKQEGEYRISLKCYIDFTDCSHIFENCKNIKELDLSLFVTKNVTNMSYMFYNCSNLNNVDLSKFSTKIIDDMSYMFYNCKNLLINEINITIKISFINRFLQL